MERYFFDRSQFGARGRRRRKRRNRKKKNGPPNPFSTCTRLPTTSPQWLTRLDGDESRPSVRDVPVQESLFLHIVYESIPIPLTSGIYFPILSGARRRRPPDINLLKERFFPMRRYVPPSRFQVVAVIFFARSEHRGVLKKQAALFSISMTRQMSGFLRKKKDRKNGNAMRH